MAQYRVIAQDMYTSMRTWRVIEADCIEAAWKEAWRQLADTDYYVTNVSAMPAPLA